MLHCAHNEQRETEHGDFSCGKHNKATHEETHKFFTYKCHHLLNFHFSIHVIEKW